MKTTKYKILNIFCPSISIKTLMLIYLQSRGLKLGVSGACSIEIFTTNLYDKHNKYIYIYHEEKHVYHSPTQFSDALLLQFDDLDKINEWLEATYQDDSIKIGKHIVTFKDNGDIKVGCQEVTWKQLDTIYQMAANNVSRKT